MLLGIVTLFPEMFHAVTHYGITGRAIRNNILIVKLWNPKKYTQDQKHYRIDDRPYGGGPGMLMMIQPLRDTINQAKSELGKNIKVVYLSPQGKKIDQQFILKLVHEQKNLIFVCGRYQGIDARLMIKTIDEEWSIGDYVLSGGELAAMVLIDTISRILPGVLGNSASKELDSFVKGKLDCPYYTRPKVFAEMKVPSVLLSGNHKNIIRWRLKHALGNTWIKRPDLLNKLKLTREEEILLAEFKNEYSFALKKI